MIVKYVRNNRRIPSGVVVVLRDSKDQIRFGWSLHRKNDGPFVKARGLEMAIGRATMNSLEPMPMTIARVLQNEQFVERCKKYFKQDRLF